MSEIFNYILKMLVNIHVKKFDSSIQKPFLYSHILSDFITSTSSIFFFLMFINTIQQINYTQHRNNNCDHEDKLIIRVNIINKTLQMLNVALTCIVSSVLL